MVLKPRRVAALSPVMLPPPAGMSVGLAVGKDESDEFKQQSHQLSIAWSAAKPLIVAAHHFGMLEGLNGGVLLKLAISLTEV